MSSDKKPVELEQVSCDICLKEVPISESTTPETDEYVAHFCGLECYEKWKMQNKNTSEHGNTKKTK